MKYYNILLLIVLFLSVIFNIYSDSFIQRIGTIIAMFSMLILLLYKNEKKNL